MADAARAGGAAEPRAGAQVSACGQAGQEPRGESVARARGVHHRNGKSRQPVALDRAVDRLAEVERNLIHLFFYKDLTQTEIARRLGFSQKHISRLLAQSLRKLKEDLR